MEWLRDNWLKVHLVITPLGTLVVTWAMLLGVGAEQWWESRNTLELAGQAVPFGGIVYGSSVLVLEVTARMLWALVQRQKDIEKARREGLLEGRQEGREEGREKGREETLRDLLARGVELPPDILKDVKSSD